MDVAEEDAVGALPPAAVVVEAEGDHVLHVVGVLERLDGRVEVGLVRQVDALQDGALRVQQVPVVVAAAAVVLRQHAVGAGAGALAVSSVEAQLLAAAVVVPADVGAWGERSTFVSVLWENICARLTDRPVLRFRCFLSDLAAWPC